MKEWNRAVNDAALSGGLASALSTVVLAWRGGVDLQAPAATLNAPSHWFWRQALAKNQSSLKYTFVGMVVHHLASVFWACLYERISPPEWQGPQTALRNAATVAGVAALVDFRAVPERLTPGFERRITSTSLLTVYVAFAGGLALASLLRARKARR